MKRLVLVVSFLLFLFFSFTASAYDLSFEQVEQICEQEGGSYSVSKDAAPEIDTTMLPVLDVSRNTRKEITPIVEPLLLPARFDWRDAGGVSPTKHQGSCGSCWAFALVGAMESQVMIHEQIDINLSEQELMDCNKYGYGCSGGYLHAAYFFKDHGSCLEEDKPYYGYQLNNPSCSLLEPNYSVSDWGFIPGDEITEIKQYLMQYGPLASYVAWDSVCKYYSGGVFTHDSGLSSINHAVMIVGWDDTLGQGCWIIKNSHGTSWGEEGIGYFQYGICLLAERGNLALLY